MGVTATTRLPAGWYPDPEGGDRRRWWDGQEWTQYTAEFQRHTSVDELDLEPEATGPAAEPAKPAKKPGKSLRAARKPRQVEEDDAQTPDDSTTPERTAPMHATAERLGRWLAGAVHFGPSVRKRRRAHRSTR